MLRLPDLPVRKLCLVCNSDQIKIYQVRVPVQIGVQYASRGTRIEEQSLGCVCDCLAALLSL